jgi:hypothetical protein
MVSLQHGASSALAVWVILLALINCVLTGAENSAAHKRFERPSKVEETSCADTWEACHGHNCCASEVDLCIPDPRGSKLDLVCVPKDYWGDLNEGDGKKGEATQPFASCWPSNAHIFVLP